MCRTDFFQGSCCGNKFIVRRYDETVSFTENQDISSRLICENGADTALVLRNSDAQTCELLVFEKDKSVSDFCGNGALFLGYFCHKNKIKTASAAYHVYRQDDFIFLEIPKAHVEQQDNLFCVTGIEPHIVWCCDEKEVSMENAVQLYNQFKGQFNITFLSSVSANEYKTRTYERGVDNFTLACGTGIIASMTVLSKMNPSVGDDNPVLFRSLGGYHYADCIENDMIRIWTHKDNLKLTGEINETLHQY